MPLSQTALVFGLNNTTNRFHAATLADQLGPACLNQKTHPKVSFPSDWVLEKSKGTVELARYAVKYCNDPDVLGQIARKDRRLAVMKSLAGNRHLTFADYTTMLERADFSHYYDIESARDRLRLDDPVPEPPPLIVAEPVVEPLTLKDVLGQIQIGTATSALLGTLLEEEAASGKLVAIAAYLKLTFVSLDNEELWRGVPYTALEALALYSPANQTSALANLVNCLYAATEQRELISLEVAQLFVERAVPTNGGVSYGPTHEIFTQEAVEYLLDYPAWGEILTHQTLSEEQFLRLLTAPLRPWRELFAHLHGSESRLVALVEFMQTLQDPPKFFDSEWNAALSCVADVESPLLTAMLTYSDETTLRHFIEGRFELTVNRQKVIIEPTIEQVLDLYARDPGCITGLHYQLRDTAVTGKLSKGYRQALLLRVPSVAYSCLEYSQCSEHIYEQLTATGAPEDEVLAAVDTLREASLESVIATLKASVAKAQ